MTTPFSNTTREKFIEHVRAIEARRRDYKPPTPEELYGEAATALGVFNLYPDKIPLGLVPYLSQWEAAGRPERTADLDSAMEAIRAIKCEHSPGGIFCRKIGCPQSQEHHVACVWLYRMATADCPAGKFKDTASEGVGCEESSHISAKQEP